jgi:uncharacterized protein YukE
MEFVAKTLKDTQDTIDSFSKNIDDFWNGKAKDTFVANKDEALKSIQELSQQVQTNSENLAKAITVYEESHQVVIEKVDSLSTANIF